MPEMRPILETVGLHKSFAAGTGWLGGGGERFYAVRGVDLRLYPNETLGLVGESGCGKSTLARLMLMLERPDSGRIFFDGRDLLNDEPFVKKELRRRMQVVFQDPFGSLNPRKRILAAVEEPLCLHRMGSRAEIRLRALDLLGKVGISREMAGRYPHEFSGGQRQRICIARALAVGPEVLVCDEPVSALDVSIQAQVINLLVDLRREYNLASVFISHDLAVIGYVSHRVAVMYRGKVVEQAGVDAIFGHPLHPYTVCLLEAVPEPVPGAARRTCHGAAAIQPQAGEAGCPFLERCPRADMICMRAEPQLVEKSDGHWVACHLC